MLNKKILFIVILFISISYLHISFSESNQIADIQKKISDRSDSIKSLEKEIALYQKEINALDDQVDSLARTIKEIDLNKKKLEAKIKLVQNQILNKTYEIETLNKNITEKVDNISEDKRIIKQTLISMHEQDSHSIVENILSENSLNSSWDSMTRISQIQDNLIKKIKDLSGTKQILETNKDATIKAKNELISLNKELDIDRKALQDNINEKNALLAETKQSEAEYTRILTQKQNLKDAFEREMASLETELKIKVDSSRLPHSGSKILSWPLREVKITQYFGNTPFATQNPQVYNGAGHTGIDLKAYIGTPVYAALDGIVIGVANTDIVRTCYSYGKWIMIRHENGLSTLYAHLSNQSVSVGQKINRGDIIGYSGNTGYSTGPHLHFGVYASDGVQITKLTSSKNCRGVTLPLADRKAYLNPLSYM